MKLHKLSLLGPVAGALMLMSALVPRANAATAGLQYYFDFNLEPDNTSANTTPLTSRSPNFGTTPAQPFMVTSLFNGEAGLVSTLFTGNGAGAGATVQTNTGSTTNLFGNDTAGGALRLRSNTTSAADINCFTIGPMNFTGLEDASLSFAIKGGGSGGFTSFSLAYSYDNVSFTDFATNVAITSTSYQLKTFDLSSFADGQSSVYISFCFTGSTNTGVATATFIDNIQITAAVPEPTTAMSGVLATLAVFGLCWSQRRLLLESLRLRRT